MNGRIAMAGLALLAAACSSTPEPPKAAVAVPQRLEPGAEPETLRYINPDVDLRRFKAFRIDPVAIYNGADADFGEVSDADKQNLAVFMRQEFTRTLRRRARVVTTSGSGVLRIQLTLAGVEVTRPAIATVTHLVPAGLAMNLVKGGTSGEGSFMGSVTIAADLYDSATNQLVGSFLTRQHPNAMDVSAVVTGLGAARAGITETAEKFAGAVEKIKASGKLPPAPR